MFPVTRLPRTNVLQSTTLGGKFLGSVSGLPASKVSQNHNTSRHWWLSICFVEFCKMPDGAPTRAMVMADSGRLVEGLTPSIPSLPKLWKCYSLYYKTYQYHQIQYILEKRGTKASFCSGKVSPKKLKS